MSEILEGVLSEALLNELASDLGMDATILRSHPIFRVLKGRVLLTYPLRTGSSCFEYQEPATVAQLNPAAGIYYTLIDEENVLLKYIVLMHDAGVNKQVGAKLTIDGVEYSNFNAAMPTAELQYVQATVTELGATTWIYGTDKVLAGGLDTLEGVDVHLEVKANNDLGAGKTLWAAAYWGKLP